MSFCDDCIHEDVCRFKEEIKRHECAPIHYLSGYTNGPTVKYAVDCPYKIVPEVKESKEPNEYIKFI